MKPAIRVLLSSDIEDLLQHMAAHQRESGRDGDPIFMPLGAEEVFAFEQRRQEILTAWAKDLTQPGWRRELGCFEDGVLAGHLSLLGAELPACGHRVSIGMGVLRDYRRRGVGRALVRAGLYWLREAGSFDWVDLCVFAHNDRALRLYQDLGFRENGRLLDRFRVDGQRIDDIQMSLRIK
jgi:RimJ/RimL family protein N-acetyltransferase